MTFERYNFARPSIYCRLMPIRREDRLRERGRLGEGNLPTPYSSYHATPRWVT